MAFSLVASVTKAAGPDGTVSAAIDTTGAKLLIFSISYFALASVSDSKGNTWIPLTQRSGGSGIFHRFYYVLNPIVGPGHTFSIFGVNGFQGFVVHAYSGNSISFVSENGAGGTATTSASTGNVTPTINNSLIASGLAIGDVQTPSINLGFTSTLSPGVAGNSLICTLAYLIQTTAAAVNPTWSWSISSVYATSIAVFSEPAIVSIPESVVTFLSKPV